MNSSEALILAVVNATLQRVQTPLISRVDTIFVSQASKEAEAMCLITFLITLGVAVVTHATEDDVDTAKGLRFLGVGYNILTGNPDGGQLSLGGVDPGLLSVRKIFKLTWDTNKTSVDGLYRVPDQVVFVHRSSCVETTTNEVFSGAKSYQDKLKVDVAASAGYDALLWSVAFSLSASYEKMEKETKNKHKVFFEKKKVCNNGAARYQLDLARVEKYSVTKDFAAAVCSLPKEYDQGAYREFIDNWGTDIVLQVVLGTKTTERRESSYTKIAKYAMENIGASVSASGGYGGFSASLQVDVSKFKESTTDTTNFTENTVKFTSGGPDMPEPIKLTLMPIYKAVEDSFFSVLDQQYQCKNLAQRKGNFKKILQEYPQIYHVSEPRDPLVRIPLTWPSGTYGLPMTKSGCPKGNFWHQGTRFHDTEDDDSSNSWSDPYDLAGTVSKNNMEQKFCMKTKSKASEFELSWPKGKYCIYKKGDCPEGFGNGYVKWDDEDDDNANNVTGQLPDGNYGRNTRIFFCCRDDGYATNVINLPTDAPFVLLKSNTHLCQIVNNTKITKEYFRWDNEDRKPHITESGDKHPYLDIDDNNLKIDYCYYYKSP
ncbi:uncharacterized protein [Montipora capricornis]|uniref:uncharacterized protein isoform X1 n=2 Tax=Montipora capricornis TaxID=246305 RepID=UPI0035F15286